MKDSKNFIIKAPKSSNKTIRMPNDLIAELEELASSNDISFNQLVIQCCKYALKNLPSSVKQE
jgi:predicted HicB family RNase H-like nuclease